MMNSTVGRGSINVCTYFPTYSFSGGLSIYDPSLTLVGAVQPPIFVVLVNKPDPQGYFDR